MSRAYIGLVQERSARKFCRTAAGYPSTVYDGTLLTGGGGVTSITNSSGVVWSFTEVR
jgi:hypothetical protein